MSAYHFHQAVWAYVCLCVWPLMLSRMFTFFFLMMLWCQSVSEWGFFSVDGGVTSCSVSQLLVWSPSPSQWMWRRPMRVCLWHRGYVCTSCCECILGCVYWSKTWLCGPETTGKGKSSERKKGRGPSKHDTVREVTLGGVAYKNSGGPRDLPAKRKRLKDVWDR